LRLLRTWIEKNQPFDPLVWNPYPVSVRIVNWLLVGQMLQQARDHDAEAYCRSVITQTAFLYRHLEFDILGNHLVKNARALIVAGLAFEGGEAHRWLRKGLKIWRRQLEEQVLEDGGHFERSPMYHMDVLQDCLEIALILRENGVDLDTDTKHKIEQMVLFLAGMLHEDGDIPLFNDAAIGVRHPELIFALADAFVSGWRDKLPDRADQRIASFSSSGYFVIRSDQSTMVVDCGAPCPDYLPPHAHADLLSFELTLGGRRLIVDSGVETYETGLWRDYYRSTRAHNTVMVDGVEQSEAWGAFRMGRRAIPIGAAVQESENLTHFRGGNGGYAFLGVQHVRDILLVDQSFWVIVDYLEGKGRHRAQSFVHVHPEVDVAAEDSLGFRFACGDEQAFLGWFHCAAPTVLRRALDPIQGWYAPHFGVRQPNTVLVWEKEDLLPFRFGYFVLPRIYDHVEVSWHSQDQLVMCLDQIIYEIGFEQQQAICRKRNAG